MTKINILAAKIFEVLKQFLKRRLTYTDILLILVNLVPVSGVWFNRWNAGEVFIIYCLESVIAGIYNVLMMLVTTYIKKKDVWQNGNYQGMVSGYWFIVFFVVHYGFFVWVQMGIFLDVSGYKDHAFGFTSVADFLFHLRCNIAPAVQWVLLLFIISYGLVVVKNFILTGVYKTASLGTLMFAPYARIFIQQFCVILGSFFLQFGGGAIFILIFAIVKTFFEIILDYQKILNISQASVD